jgi:hypothetical protein
MELIEGYSQFINIRFSLNNGKSPHLAIMGKWTCTGYGRQSVARDDHSAALKHPTSHPTRETVFRPIMAPNLAVSQY